MHAHREQQIRALFDTYIRLYASRDERLTELFSDEFSGYTGGGAVLVHDRLEWVRITLQDFAQVPLPIRIEMLDLALQDLSDDVVATTAFFHIHLPMPEHTLAREVARLVLIFRLEAAQWKIVHSGISIPYHLVRDGEVYPLAGLQERNRELETEIRIRTQELHQSEALYRQLIEDTLDIIWKADRDLRVTYISPADERLRGYRACEVLGRHLFEMLTDEGAATAAEQLQRAPPQPGPPRLLGFMAFEAQHRCKDGSLRWGEVMARVRLDEHGAVTGYQGITRDITERKLLEQQVRQLAFHDALTDLPNRRLLLDRLAQAMTASSRSGHCGALLFLDLDNFKALNDRHGHDVGDAVLLQAASRLEHCVRRADTVARLGGDEFIVLLPSLDIDRRRSATQALGVADKILKALSEPYRLSIERDGGVLAEVEHRCTASIGVSLFTGQEAGTADVLKWADSAMYRAKDTGRNTVRLYGDAPADAPPG
ncbi:hypothetical protein CKO44_08780 [Rubrivivax gelatinosus]|nr:hypothetical protein [Rubrivivax gelatinosus]